MGILILNLNFLLEIIFQKLLKDLGIIPTNMTSVH